MRVEATGLWIEFPFPERDSEGGGTTQETTQEKIVALVRANPSVTRRELAEKIGLTPDGIKYHLQKLTKAGVIRHVGPTKSGHWEILND